MGVGLSGSDTGADLIRELADAVAGGTAVASAVVVDTARSVPRRPGARMLVFGDGRIRGTVGGGEMEARVAAEAVESLGDGRPRMLAYRLVQPDKGDPGVCGGDISIFVEPHMPQPRMIVIGYGHVGRAVARLAGWLDFRVTACDDRDGLEAEAEGADELFTGSVADLVADRGIGADTSVVLVTRNVDLDVAALTALLPTEAGYIGVMGSDRRWSTVRTRLEAQGADPADLDRVNAPIGVEIGAETPSEIAVSIMAQVIAHRRG